MPLYEYHCNRCRHLFDTIVPADMRDQVKCPKCRRKAKRQLSIPNNVTYNGSGWTKG